MSIHNLIVNFQKYGMLTPDSVNVKRSRTVTESLHFWNPDTCECDCRSTCSPSKTQRDPVKCECKCPQIFCTNPPNAVLNDDTCECECPLTQCTHLNPTICKCDYPDCPPGSVPDNVIHVTVLVSVTSSSTMVLTTVQWCTVKKTRPECVP